MKGKEIIPILRADFPYFKTSFCYEPDNTQFKDFKSRIIKQLSKLFEEEQEK